MRKTFSLLIAIFMIATLLLSACAQPTAAPAPAENEAPAEVETEAPAVEEPAVEEPVVEETEAPAVEEPEEPTAAPTEEPVETEAVSGLIADLPRNETLYFNGLQWNPIKGWNPYSSDMNNAMAIGDGGNNYAAQLPMFEALYMFNMMDGKQYPLLADGDFTWNDDMTEITVKIKPAAKWSDGTPVTADDVAYTFASHLKYETSNGAAYKDYIETVEAADPATAVIKAKLTEDGKAVNPLVVAQYLSHVYVLQKAWTETLEERTGGDPAAFKSDPGEDVVWSGPYKQYFADDQKVVLERDDNYWGQDASMWGSLPVPKYLAHTIFADNNAGLVALQALEVDVSQQFNANVQDLWLQDDLPVSTYLPEAPYMIAGQLPTAYYNLKSFGLDRVEVRKAIAMAVDYDTIIANAMTNQSPTFSQVPRSVMNPTAGEQALYDQAAVADLQWTGNDVEGANALLDEAGIVDTDGDGWREIDGQNLAYKALCPNGWSDWQAAIEIVAAAGEKIGINITSEFPEWAVYQTVFTDATVNNYDIFMVWSNGASPTSPWGRVRQFMSAEFAGTSNNWNGNWGGYTNPRVDELLALIPIETDQAKLVEYYTELTEIYLTDVPSFTLMYRPDFFHTVNESVWTNFPNADDGSDPPIPPTNLVKGYGIAGLYNLELVEP
jgi:peptide/nickel transport system substrate-binding protein